MFKKIKNISTSKAVMALLIFNFIALQIFTGYIVVSMMTIAPVTGIIDFTPLVALISTVVGEVTTFMIYVIKSTKENTVGGLVYETAMQDLSYDRAPTAESEEEDD